MTTNINNDINNIVKAANGFFDKLIQFSINQRWLVMLISIALGKNTNNQGAGYIEKQGEQYLIRVPGQIVVDSKNQLLAINALSNFVVDTRQGTPIKVQDVAVVSIGSG